MTRLLEAEGQSLCVLTFTVNLEVEEGGGGKQDFPNLPHWYGCCLVLLVCLLWFRLRFSFIS